MQWTGARRERVETVSEVARPLRWKGGHPRVELVTTTDETGVKLTKEAMAGREPQVKRLPDLETWVVDIIPPKAPG